MCKKWHTLEGVDTTPEGITDTDTRGGGITKMICLDSKCPYCRDGHHCAFVETDDLPCMMEDD